MLSYAITEAAAAGGCRSLCGRRESRKHIRETRLVLLAVDCVLLLVARLNVVIQWGSYKT